MKCTNGNCSEEAIVEYDWPGVSEKLYACSKHWEKAKKMRKNFTIDFRVLSSSSPEEPLSSQGEASSSQASSLPPNNDA